MIINLRFLWDPSTKYAFKLYKPGDKFETYFTTKGLTKDIAIDSSFHCSFINDLKLENDNSIKLSLINKVTLPYESLEFKSLKKKLKIISKPKMWSKHQNMAPADPQIVRNPKNE